MPAAPQRSNGVERNAAMALDTVGPPSVLMKSTVQKLKVSRSKVRVKLNATTTRNFRSPNKSSVRRRLKVDDFGPTSATTRPLLERGKIDAHRIARSTSTIEGRPRMAGQESWVTRAINPANDTASAPPNT